MSRLDQVYRRLLISKFFTKGWGTPENLKRLFEFRKIISNRETCQHLVSNDWPIHIDVERVHKNYRVLEGHFTSPFDQYLPGIMPPECQTARFQMLLPNQWRGALKPVCLHLGGTGDHHYWRRRIAMAQPLLKESGIASIILENPYYGVRKPKKQVRSSLHNVSDLFVMGGSLVLESLALFHWCENQGWGPLGITGISMGGFMASLAATNWHKPVSLIPCLSWSTASVVFTRGVISGAIPWDTLQHQYFEDSVYENEIRHLLQSPESADAYWLGQHLVRDYPACIDEVDDFKDRLHADMKQKRNSKKKSLQNDVADSQSHATQGMQHNSESQSHATQGIQHNSESQSHATQGMQHNSESQSHATQGMQYNSDAIASDIHLNNHQQNKAVDHLMECGHSGQSNPIDLVYTNTNNINAITNTYNDNFSLNERSSLRSTSTRPVEVSSAGLGLSSKPLKSKSNHKSSMAQREAVDFMRGVMDECTHLGNFSVPVDPELIIVVSALDDAYVPRDNVQSLERLWPGSEMRYIDAGHIRSLLFYKHVFRQAIVDSFSKQVDKYLS